MKCKECGCENMWIKPSPYGYFAECKHCYYIETDINPNIYLLEKRTKKLNKILEKMTIEHNRWLKEYINLHKQDCLLKDRKKKIDKILQKIYEGSTQKYKNHI